MNNVNHLLPGDRRRARRTKVQIQLAAIAALESRGDGSFIGQAAPLAKWRLNVAYLGAATAADETLARRRPRATKLAGFGVQEAHGGVRPAFERFRECHHNRSSSLLILILLVILLSEASERLRLGLGLRL